MGFRSGAYATVWSSEPISDVNTKIRISISRKNKNTGDYEQDFSGFVACIGSVAAKKAATLKEKDRIKLGDTDVSTYYDPEKKRTYFNFKLFSFENANRNETDVKDTDVAEGVDDGEPDLPF